MPALATYVGTALQASRWAKFDRCDSAITPKSHFGVLQFDSSINHHCLHSKIHWHVLLNQDRSCSIQNSAIINHHVEHQAIHPSTYFGKIEECGLSHPHAILIVHFLALIDQVGTEAHRPIRMGIQVQPAMH